MDYLIFRINMISIVFWNGSLPDSLFEGDTLYVLDVMFSKIIDRFLMVFSLLMSSFFNMKIVDVKHYDDKHLRSNVLWKQLTENSFAI